MSGGICSVPAEAERRQQNHENIMTQNIRELVNGLKCFQKINENRMDKRGMASLLINGKPITIYR